MPTEAEATEENAALTNLDNLDSVEPDDSNADDSWLDQAEAERQAEESEQKAREAAKQGAAWAIGALEALVGMQYPYVQVDDGTRQRLNEKTEAVLYKHGGGLPPWLEPYREEIELGVALATAGFVIYVQVQAHERAEAEREAKEQTEQGAAGYAHEAE